MQLLTIQFVFSRYDILIQKGNRMYANQENIEKLEAVQVTKAPPTTTATIKYEAEYNEKEPLSNVNDRWNWDRSQPCKRSGICKRGRRTLQICRGLKECGNPQCSFRKIHKTPNKVDFTRRKACLHCKSPFTLIAQQGNT